MQTKEIKNNIPHPYLLFIIIASVLVISGGIVLFFSQKNKLTQQKQNELEAISSLKVAEISRWRQERLGDGNIFSSIVQHEEIVYSEQPESINELKHKMAAFVDNYDYKNILLVDSTGTVKQGYPSSNTYINLPEMMAEISQNPAVRLSDLHYSNDLPGFIHIDVQVPLFSSGGNLIGAIIMTVDPNQILFPLIQSWPAPSGSSETLVVRSDGDSLIFLNELRHRSNTAMKYKFPLDYEDLPAAKAVQGYEGVFEGKDYRGIQVISYLQKIPNSDWFMVAKVDKKEVYAPLKEQIILISSLGLLLLLSVIIFTIYYLRSKHIGYLQELNATKDKFFSIVSHDLKSPFVSINGFAQLLNDDVYKKDLNKVQQYAGIILDSSHKAMDFLNNLSEWSKLQTNRIPFNPGEMEVSPVVGEVIGLMNAAAMKKSISLTHEIPDGLKIHADKQLISLILRNLVSNSIKFSHPGSSVNIIVRSRMNATIFEVRDQGTGISKEIMGKLFHAGESVSTHGTQKEYGTGLGLILVREFVTLHGGEIHVESKIGKGSSFIVTLPS